MKMAGSSLAARCYLCLLFSVVTANEVTPSYNMTESQTVFMDQNFTATASTVDGSTTTRPNSTEYLSPSPEPDLLPAESLPVSGCLLTPSTDLTDVDSFCPCDEHQDVCDINCCCDTKCSEDVSLFTSCSVSSISVNTQLCSHSTRSYLLQSTIDGFSQLQSSVWTEMRHNILCIQWQNRVDGFSHPPPALPTDNNFDFLFKQFSSNSAFSFSSPENSDHMTTGPQVSSGYQYGDVMGTAEDKGHRGMFHLPTSGVTAACVDTSPAAFLKQQSSRCSRRVVVEHDCRSLPSLRMDTYTNIQLYAERSADAVVVPVRVISVLLESLDGTQHRLQTRAEQTVEPELVSSKLCANVLLKVEYLITYSRTGQIVKASVSVVLGFVHEDSLQLEQQFVITFAPEAAEDVGVPVSGSPGYVLGLPLLSAGTTASGLTRSTNPVDTLSLLHSVEDQDCLQSPQSRSPVLFGVDYVSGCTLRLQEADNCSLVSQLVLDVLRGQNFPRYVAAFGNSPLDSPLDWVPIKSMYTAEEASSCSIPLSLHLLVEWTQYGSLVNPQAQIVSVREVIRTNTSRLATLSAGSSVLSVRSSVSFHSVSAAARPGLRAKPTINAKLPFDFFFPFV